MKIVIDLMLTENEERQLVLKNNTVKSQMLFGQSTEITIVHNQEEYTLRLTKNDKLILTK